MGKSGKTAATSAQRDARKPRHQDASKQKFVKPSSEVSIPSHMTTYAAPPEHWPTSMPYLSTSLESQSLTLAQKALVHPITLVPPPLYSIPSLATFSPSPNPLVHIRPITDPSHPAYPQSGLFAARTLPPGTHIIDYTGLLHPCPLSSCATSDYDLAFLDRDASLAIDSAEMGNQSRFINDYHGVRDAGPNAVFEEYFVKVRSAQRGGTMWEARMGVWVAPAKPSKGKDGRDGILKGDEICVSYGRGWWRARQGCMERQSHGPTTNAEGRTLSEATTENND